MKDDISHEEYRSKLANVAGLAVSYINTGNGYFRMRDAFNQLAEQCGANKGINDEATVGRRKLLAQSVCIECISRLSSHSNDRLQGEALCYRRGHFPKERTAQMIFSLLRKTVLPVMVIIFKIHGTWINKRYITASRCPMYRWSIFAARSTRLTAWNASCLLPLLLNVKQLLFLSARTPTSGNLVWAMSG